jgi:hypothetical protein
MATLLNIDYQKYVQLPDGTVIGIHRVTLLSASDTFSVPDLADPSNAGRSAAQLRRAGDTSVTVSTTGANTITLAGTAGTQCTVVSWHTKHTSMPTDPGF